MKTGVILAAGAGTRIWPYAVVRPKVMIPVANRPIVSYAVDAMKAAGIQRIIIAASDLSERIANYYRNDGSVSVFVTGRTKGTAETLGRVLESCEAEGVLVMYGDSIVGHADVKRLLSLFAEKGNAVLVQRLPERETSRDWVCCTLKNGLLASIVGHPRDEATHRFCAFALKGDIFPYVRNNSGIFTDVQVGMMPPLESYLEMSLSDFIRDGGRIAACETESDCIDIDKPWHILMANSMVLKARCGELTRNECGEGSSIDPSADISGFVRLGRESRIGRNVRIKGSLIAGDNTIIENGAMIEGDAIVGNDSYIGNYCLLSDCSTVGDRCVVNHCAELDGIIMDTVYLYHYMEFYGIIGSNTDLGAATVCGTLRFDDGETVHRIKGRREYPLRYANASYIGDYARTGVNAVIMPGVKVGVYSIVGPGVILSEDIPDRTIVMAKQEQERRSWGPERYGW
ncbi:MAG TPA: NTP transferase domain-containing protein [Spirochaetia bacterium]|nr:NTP transferase domain-containing protein [Spirochaetia bacterium]